MTTPASYCVVMTTTSSAQHAEDLAQKIVSAKLGACVQVQQIKSFYMWQGKACADPESLLMVKARTAQYAELEAFIKAHHTYDTPEIIQIPITAGSARYFQWMDEVTSA